MAWQGIKSTANPSMAADSVAMTIFIAHNQTIGLDSFTPGANNAGNGSQTTRFAPCGVWFDDAKPRGVILNAFELAADAALRDLLRRQMANLAAARPYNQVANQWYDNGDTNTGAYVQRSSQAAGFGGVAAGDRSADLVGALGAIDGTVTWNLDAADAAGRAVFLTYDYGAVPQYFMQAIARYREFLPRFIPAL